MIKPPPRNPIAKSIAGWKRRDFLRRGGGAGLAGIAGMALGGLPFVAGCGGGGDDGVGVGAPTPTTYQRTLFFNLSHLDHANRDYGLVAGRRVVKLVPTAADPAVLAQARTNNAFIASVPDEQVTHHVEGLELANDIVTLGFVVETVPGDTSGRWTMGAMHLLVPPSGYTAAYARVPGRAAAGPLPLSSKRRRYGVAAARTEQDLHDEAVLLDTTNHAATCVMMHPNLLALDPGAAGHVMVNHVDSFALDVLQDTIDGLGSAQPEVTAGQPNASGWATMRPVMAGGQQATVPTGPAAGRLQYHPRWHPDVVRDANAAMVQALSTAQDDETLGFDVTADPPATDGRGTLWARRDGRTVRDAMVNAALDEDTLQMQADEFNPDSGLDYKVSTEVEDGKLTLKVTLDNWYLRYLGAYLQFLDIKGDPIALDNIGNWKSKTLFVEPATQPQISTDGFTALAGTVPPPFTIAGIPLGNEAATGKRTFAIAVPSEALKVRLMAGGLGGGSNNFPGTVVNGAVLTVFINYGCTLFFAALGAAELLGQLEVAAAPVLEVLAEELTQILTSIENGEFAISADFWREQGITIVETIAERLISEGGSEALAAVIGVFTEAAAEAVAETLPVIGQIFEGISCLTALADLIVTSYGIGVSPWTYINEVSFTHTLVVNLLPDENDNAFPAAANAYRVTATLPGQTPHEYNGVLSGPTSQTLVIEFPGLPRGGTVAVAVSFVQRGINGGADILLGSASVDDADNGDEPIELQITEYPFPIDASTRYLHSQKTVLTDSDMHAWQNAAAPTASALNCGSIGTICSLDGLTVVQGTQSNPGYVGYAWKSHNSDPSRVPGCGGGGAGQQSQYANLNTDPDNADQGYALSGCGLSAGGASIAYNLLGTGAGNYFLDTSDSNAPLIRSVNLRGTPVFDPAGGGQSWGVLNLPSDRLLVHPNGRALSLNRAESKLETHRLPGKSLADGDARQQLRAQLRSGRGGRPGLMAQPVAAAIGSDGIVVVLEQGNNRLHAFDQAGNAVPYFSGQTPAYFLTLSSTDPANGWEHLDVAIEFTGLVYVLSRRGALHRVAIFKRDQQGTAPLAYSEGINAGRIAVNYWRSLYTLNYEVIQRANSANTTPAPVTEPSVSLWVPCSLNRTC